VSALNVSSVMDAIAARIVAAGVTTRAYAWPTGSIQPPCAIVGYPEELEFDATFGRGSDRAVFPVWMVCGNVSDRSARDVLSGYITGGTGIKDALDGTLGGAVQTARVTDCQVEKLPIGAVEYIAAKFMIEVYS
jgi:hypothetical protein